MAMSDDTIVTIYCILLKIKYLPGPPPCLSYNVKTFPLDPEGAQHHCRKTALSFSQKCLLCN